MHAEVVVDDVQLVDVDVERGPVTRAAFFGDSAADALFESGSGVQTAQGIVTALDDADRLAREDVAQTRVPIDEVLAEILAKQREYADGTPGQRAQRT